MFENRGFRHNRDLYSQPGNIAEDPRWHQTGLGSSIYLPSDVPGGDGVTNNFHVAFAGTSNWRRYWLDCAVPGNTILPAQVEINIYLGGKGTVYLRPIKLIASNLPHNWRSPQMAGLIGGTAGAVLGCLGGLLGCLAGMGKARWLVLTLTKGLILLGIVSTIVGVVAIACRQPYAVWYPLVLTGGILTFVFSVNFYPVKRRYEDLEIRRMTSMDATGR